MGPSGSHRRVGSVRAALVVGTVAALVVLSSGADAAPTNEQAALLVLVNASRTNPAATGSARPPAPPLVWHDGLATGASLWLDRMSTDPNSPLHESGWAKRVGKHYPDWRALGEVTVTAMATDATAIHAAIMSTTLHRDMVLSSSYDEVGFAIGLAATTAGGIPVVVGDLGSVGPTANETRGALPVGCVLPRAGASGTTRRLLANYYHFGGGAPRVMRARLGSSCVGMNLRTGVAANGMYGADRSLSGAGCVPLVFEAVRSDGRRFVYPTDGSILLSLGGATCAERTTDLPAADCGDGPLPPPRPTPGPPPATADQAKVVIRPSASSPDLGNIQVSRVVDLPAGFGDGSAVAISLALPGDRWAIALPTSCNGGPCLRANARGTTWTGSWAPGRRLTLSRKGGRWKMKFVGKAEALPALSPGIVNLAFTADGLTGESDIAATVRSGVLVAR